jgi:UDP-N-acetyl-D-mannosaminuronic acid dehydrogenase
MINEWSPYPDLLLSAWKMNEYIPAFLVQHLRQRTSLQDRRVAMLGYSFKADTDDVRDSLAPKLYRYLERETPLEIRVSDGNLPDPTPAESGTAPLRNWPLDEALAEVDCVFVATNHREYGPALQRLALTRPHAWVADIWNVGGIDQIFYQAGALLR